MIAPKSWMSGCPPEFLRLQLQTPRKKISTKEQSQVLNVTARLHSIVPVKFVDWGMQGFSISDISDKLNVSHQAVSKTLKQVQNIVKELFPESVNGFKEKRIVNR